MEIPQQRITERLAQQFKELRKQAAIPGFRTGHARRKLVEKRFANNMGRTGSSRDLISEIYRQAVEKNSLTVVGEPELITRTQSPSPPKGT